MKKKIVSIIFVSVMALQIAGCGAGDTSKKEGMGFETVSEAQESSMQETGTMAETAAEGVSAESEVSSENTQENVTTENETQKKTYDFEDQYYAGKGNISITQEENGTFLIEVWWGSSASEHSEWVMNGTYDEGTKKITYSDCVKHDFTLKENGEVDTDITAYTDGTGSIKIVDGSTIEWNDDQDHIADDIQMTR